MTPSATPSPALSQAWIAAAWKAANLHWGRKFPDTSITSWGQNSAGMNFCQLIAGAAARMPS